MPGATRHLNAPSTEQLQLQEGALPSESLITMPPMPLLSTGLQSFAASDPGGWQQLLDRARALDAAGFDRLVVSDHIVFGENMEAYARPELGGSANGRQPTGPDGHWLEPLTVLSVIAGMTKRARLGTNILVAALRRPAVLAKVTSTLDVLSGGRLDLGVGVGWQREEYVAAGLDFDERGELLNHALEICQTLWRQTRASVDTTYLRFEAIHSMPKPLQAGGVPIWVSGTVNPRVVRRLARFGAGWIPWGPAAADIRTGIVQMREALAAIGHDPTGLPFVAALPTVRDKEGRANLERTIDGVPALVELGATDIRTGFPVPGEPAQAADQLARFVAAFREAAGRPL
jgi:probable F420-dependent oxidoreductase